jgi:isopenicillin N synthase-like dioxygenase
LFRIDPSKPTDFKEAFNVTEPYNDQIPWPSGECSDFKPTVNSFFHTCEKLALGVLDLISLGLKLEVRFLNFVFTHSVPSTYN